MLWLLGLTILLLKIAVAMGALFTLAAYMVLVERKLLGRLQIRYGPNRVGPYGLLQPLADALKMLIKEDFEPARAERIIFRFAPAVVAALESAGLTYRVIVHDAPVRSLEEAAAARDLSRESRGAVNRLDEERIFIERDGVRVNGIARRDAAHRRRPHAGKRQVGVCLAAHLRLRHPPGLGSSTRTPGC